VAIQNLNFYVVPRLVRGIQQNQRASLHPLDPTDKPALLHKSHLTLVIASESEANQALMHFLKKA
jgi:hypothetical protein